MFSEIATLDWLFAKTTGIARQRQLNIFFLTGLYLFGILFWYKFLEFGGLFWTNNDWIEAYPMLAAWKTALSSGSLPFHVHPPISIIETSRFLTNANFPISPQLLLLVFLSPKTYVIVNHLLLYTLGFLGFLLIRKQYRFSLFSSSMFFLLFNFNGIVISHVAVGHYEWVSYFLLTFFIYFIGKIGSKERKPSDKYWLSLVLFAILIQGGIHIVNMSYIFLGILFFTYRNSKDLATTLFLSLGLGAVRFLPATLIHVSKDQFTGFINVAHFIDSSIFIRTVATLQAHSKLPHGYWEINHYVGIIGTLFIIVFGVLAFLPQANLRNLKEHRPILIALLIMTTLSFNTIWQDLIANIPLSFLNVERVPTRFIVYPLLFALLLANINFDLYVKSKPPDLIAKSKYLFLLILTGASMGFHGKAWRLYEVETSMPRNSAVDLTSIYTVVRQTDPNYINVLNVSGLITMGFLFYILFTLKKLQSK